jgi:uncharacterized cupredoxin-like copper-binding protein
MTEASNIPSSVSSAGSKGKRRREWRILLILGGSVLITVAVLWWINVAFPTTLPTTLAAHNHPVDSAVGEPGDPNLPARTIDVAMIEGDGVMKFEPASIEIGKGDQVRFKVTNRGALDHEFVLSTLTDNLQHLEEMKRLPGMKHSGPNSVSLAPNATGEILWRFTKAGSFDFSCLIPGHREAGMHGAVVVK